MKISVFGSGYVGLVTGVAFAEMGNDVICADIDSGKVAQLNNGESPIYEPGLDVLLKNNIKGKRIAFTTDLKHAVEESDLLFIAVGTPPDEDGSADLKYVLSVADTIGLHMNAEKTVINKSTVPVGTQKKVKAAIAARLQKRGVDFSYDVVSNPEFLREGNAIDDCLRPNRVVVGVESERARGLMQRLYEPFLKSGNPLLVMGPESSEMTKYAANSMLATKISLMNEFSRVCEKVGADIEQVRLGIGSDHRIGPHFIFAGIGYGGSCFPKDVQALVHIGKSVDEPMNILSAVEDVNERQRKIFIDQIRKSAGGSFKGQQIALWGIAFKPGTDDIREAPALTIIEEILKEGGKVTAYDPVAAANAAAHFKNNASLKFVEDQYDTLADSALLVIATEWKSFREPDFKRIKKTLKKPVVCDGRNIYNVKMMQELGFSYVSIGR